MAGFNLLFVRITCGVACFLAYILEILSSIKIFNENR